jgi:hypothetical protein
MNYLNKPHHIYYHAIFLRKSRIKITSLTLTWKVDDSMDNTLRNTFHRFFINPIVYC